MNSTAIQTDLSLQKILVPMVEHMITTSISLPLEMLQAAMTYQGLNSDLQMPIAKKKHSHTLDVRFCSQKITPLQTTGWLKLLPDCQLEHSGPGNLILVPALWRNPVPVIRKHPEIIEWLQHQDINGATFAVAGTGVAFMAQAGLLDHQPAATHWFYLEKLQRYFPAVDFKPNHLITRSGRIYCAGSVNSVADLMVHLISMAMGESVAHKVEQQFSHEIRRSFKDTYFSDDHATSHQDEVVLELQAWMLEHFASDIHIDQLCQQSGLNRRTLSRRFSHATGLSPMLYLKKIRLDQARDLLKKTNLGIAEIALQIGYSDPDYFRRLFKQQYQLSPSDFRRSVRGKLFYLNE